MPNTIVNALSKHFDNRENKKVQLMKLSHGKVELANIFCRSNIFAASDNLQPIKDIFHHTKLGKVQIEGSARLSQYDLDVLLIILHECSQQDRYRFTFSKREMLRRLQIGYGKNSKLALEDSLKKLSSIIVHAKSGDITITGSFLRTITIGKNHTIDVFKELIPLFESSAWISVEHRLKLSNSLSKQLYTFIMSSNIPVKMQALKTITGKEHRLNKHFNADVKKSMNELNRNGHISFWTIDRHNQLCWKK